MSDGPGTTVTEGGVLTRAGAHVTRGIGVARGRAWAGITGAVGVVSGVAPHVLHHVGPIAGAAILTGTGGSVLFGLAGFAASVPLLFRLHRRFRSWRVSVAALAVFVAMFTLSTLVIGPAIRGYGPASPAPLERGPATDSPDPHGHSS